MQSRHRCRAATCRSYRCDASVVLEKFVLLGAARTRLIMLRGSNPRSDFGSARLLVSLLCLAVALVAAPLPPVRAQDATPTADPSPTAELPTPVPGDSGPDEAPADPTETPTVAPTEEPATSTPTPEPTETLLP